MSDHDDPMIKAGLEASHLVAELRAKRKQQVAGSSYRPAFRPKGTRLPEDWILDPRNLWLDGYWRYMLDCGGASLTRPAGRSPKTVPRWRQCFMEMMELHLEHETDPDVVAGLRRELYKVRRALGHRTEGLGGSGRTPDSCTAANNIAYSITSYWASRTARSASARNDGCLTPSLYTAISQSAERMSGWLANQPGCSLP